MPAPDAKVKVCYCKIMITDHYIGKVGTKALIVKDDKILMVRTANATYWDLPGGRINNGEEVGPALQRELMEELGIQVELGPLIHSSQTLHGLDKSNQLYLMFQATLTNTDAVFAIPTEEVEEIWWLDKNQLPELKTFENCLLALKAFWNLK
jgi:8-oxo-dGTP diphosphatase